MHFACDVGGARFTGVQSDVGSDEEHDQVLHQSQDWYEPWVHLQFMGGMACRNGVLDGRLEDMSSSLRAHLAKLKHVSARQRRANRRHFHLVQVCLPGRLAQPHR